LLAHNKQEIEKIDEQKWPKRTWN